MNAYFRSRDGEADGPYFEGQLITMRQAGQLVASDQLCLQGSEDWLPTEVVMEGVLPAAAVPSVPSCAHQVRVWCDCPLPMSGGRDL